MNDVTRQSRILSLSSHRLAARHEPADLLLRVEPLRITGSSLCWLSRVWTALNEVWGEATPDARDPTS